MTRDEILAKLSLVMTEGELRIILILDSSQTIFFNDGSAMHVDKVVGQWKLRIQFKEDMSEPWGPLEYIFTAAELGLENGIIRQ